MADRSPAGPERERTVPRRVKHLIVLPGGAEAGPGPEHAPPDAGDEVRSDRARPGEARISPIPRHAASVAEMPRHAASVAVAQPAEALIPSSFKLKLTVIARSVSASRAPGMPFIFLASVLVSLAVLGLVVLHVMVDQASFRVDSLDSRAAAQQAQVRQLRYAVSAQEAPARVAAAAARLGLVPAGEVQTLVGQAASTPTSTVTAPSTAAIRPAPPAKPVAGPSPPGAGSRHR